MAGKGPKPVPGFNLKTYQANDEYWNSVEKKRKKRLKKEKKNEQEDSTKQEL